MTRYLVVLNSDFDRAKAISFVRKAPAGARCEIKAAKRTLPQNDRFWAMLSDVAVQKEHYGRKYPPEVWKLLFLDAFGREVQFIPALTRGAVVPMGQSSSDLSKAEMTELLDFIEAWAAENGVQLHDTPAQRESA